MTNNKYPHELFNNSAHEALLKILNAAEDELIANGICEAIETEEVLCRGYIEQVGGVLQHGLWFLQGEATSAAEIYLLKLMNVWTNKPSPLRRSISGTKLRACSNQLSFHTCYYFPRYHAILTQSYRERLQSAHIEVLRDVTLDGVIQLALADLPNVADEIRREARRRGMAYFEQVVPYEHGERRQRVQRGRQGRLPRA